MKIYIVFKDRRKKWELFQKIFQARLPVPRVAHNCVHDFARTALVQMRQCCLRLPQLAMHGTVDV